MFIIQQCNKSYSLDCKLSLTFSSCRFNEGSARTRCEVIFVSLTFRSKVFETALSWGGGAITLPLPLHATQARGMSPGGGAW